MEEKMWVEVFRIGKNTDSSGNTDEYSAESLDEIASAYNAKVMESDSFEAPVVKGHPKNDDPAQGWVERLARHGNKLMAKLKEMSPEFIDEIGKGLFKRVSIALYPNKMLRHLGFLGAVPPAVKGLRSAKFEDGGEFREFEQTSMFDDMDGTNDLREKKDLKDSEDSNIENETKELKVLNRQYLEKIELMEKEARLKEFREFANSLLENPDGSIITPAHSAELIDILEIAYHADTNQNELTFSDGSSYVDKVKSFFSSLKPSFNLKEFAVRQEIRNFSEYPDFSERNVSPSRLKLHEKAVEIRNSMPGISYEEAVCEAQHFFNSEF
jgi:hypothetical protein